MSTPAMIINASVPPPPATTQHTLITLSNTRENRNIRSEKLRKGAKSENKLAFVHLIYSAHFLPPTCAQPQDASGHNYSEEPSLKCTNPEPGAAAVVDVFASESSQGNGHHL